MERNNAKDLRAVKKITNTLRCRSCLGEKKKMHNLFESYYKGHTLAYIIEHTISSTEIKCEIDDGQSTHICKSCANMLVKFYDFKSLFIKNQHSFKSQAIILEESADTRNYGLESDGTKNKARDVGLSESIQSKSSSSKEELLKTNAKIKSEERSFLEVNSSHNDLYTENFFIIGADCDNANRESTVLDPLQAKITEDCDRRILCDECNDSFPSREQYKLHLIKCGKNDSLQLDNDCDVKEEIDDNELDELETCFICKKKVSGCEELKQHLRTHMKSNEEYNTSLKKYVCELCGWAFSKKSYLNDHRDIHFTVKRHVCNICKKAFRVRTALAKHRTVHTNPRNCICSQCGKAFNNKQTLKTHIMLLHIKEKNYRCLMCNQSFALKSTLDKHVFRHDKDRARPFHCDNCGMAYKDKSSLKRHNLEKHSGIPFKATCEHCGKQYTTCTKLKYHQQKHHN